MSEKRNRKNTNKWFNRECYEERKEYNKSRNSFIRNKSTKNKLDILEQNTNNRICLGPQQGFDIIGR